MYHGLGMDFLLRVPSSSPWWAGFALAALAAAVPAQDELAAQITRALDEARPALLAHLAAAAEPTTRPGELALVVLAGVHDGVPSTDKVMAKAQKRLAAAKPDQTYDLALRLLVLEACADFPERMPLARQDAKALLQHRCSAGAFQYGARPSGWDLSNTQYGALGLRAAAALGIDIDRNVWSKLAREIEAQQEDYGGFGYTRSHGRSNKATASMTAAGIAVLAICRQALGDDSPQGQQLTKSIQQGWDWFARNPATIGANTEHWSYYFHYGLERAAILCDVDTIGGGKLSWYEAGAKMLLADQLPGGGWQSLRDGFPGQHLASGRGNAVPTAFAVLFLRRKFSKLVVPISAKVATLATIGPLSKPADVEACAAELVRRGKAAMPDVVKGLRSEIQPQRQAAAKALQQLAGDAFGYEAARDAEANRDAIRRAELWFLRQR